jgi:hypothetical protein
MYGDPPPNRSRDSAYNCRESVGKAPSEEQKWMLVSARSEPALGTSNKNRPVGESWAIAKTEAAEDESTRGFRFQNPSRY